MEPRTPLPPRPGIDCADPTADGAHIANLDWYDGPLLVLTRVGAALYLVLWCDVDDETHRWLAVRISRDRLDAFGMGTVTLRSMFARPADGCVFVLDATADRTFGCSRARVDEIPADWFPGDVPHPRDEWHRQPAEAALAEVA